MSLRCRSKWPPPLLATSGEARSGLPRFWQLLSSVWCGIGLPQFWQLLVLGEREMLEWPMSLPKARHWVSGARVKPVAWNKPYPEGGVQEQHAAKEIAG